MNTDPRHPRDPRPTLDPAALSAFIAQARAAGKRVVFTNGVFDILHPGHVRYLKAARAHGDLLIVGLNSDASVRRNKGPARPINPEAHEAYLKGRYFWNKRIEGELKKGIEYFQQAIEYELAHAK